MGFSVFLTARWQGLDGVSALQHTLRCPCPLPPSVAPCPAPASPLVSPLVGKDLAFTASLFSLCGLRRLLSNPSAFWSRLPGRCPRGLLSGPCRCSSASGHWGPCNLLRTGPPGRVPFSGRVPSGQVPSGRVPLRKGPLRTGPQDSPQDGSPLRKGPPEERSPLRQVPSGLVPSGYPLSGKVPSGKVPSPGKVPLRTGPLRTGPPQDWSLSGLGPSPGQVSGRVPSSGRSPGQVPSGRVPSQERSTLRKGPLSGQVPQDWSPGWVPSQERSPRTGPPTGPLRTGFRLVPSQDWSPLRTGPLRTDPPGLVLRTGPLRKGPLSGWVPSRLPPLRDWSPQDWVPLRTGPLSAIGLLRTGPQGVTSHSAPSGHEGTEDWWVRECIGVWLLGWHCSVYRRPLPSNPLPLRYLKYP